VAERARRGAVAAERIDFHVFAAGGELAADPVPDRPVILGGGVDELAVVIEDDMPAVRLEFGDLAFEFIVAALVFGEFVFGVEGVVSAGVPAEHEQRVDPGFESRFEDLRQFPVVEELLAVLVAHDNPVPAV